MEKRQIIHPPPKLCRSPQTLSTLPRNSAPETLLGCYNKLEMSTAQDAQGD